MNKDVKMSKIIEFKSNVSKNIVTKLKAPEYIYNGEINYSEVLENAIDMELSEIFERIWQCNRREQGLSLLLKEEVNEEKIDDYNRCMAKNKNDHFFWLLVLENYIKNEVFKDKDD